MLIVNLKISRLSAQRFDQGASSFARGSATVTYSGALRNRGIKKPRRRLLRLSGASVWFIHNAARELSYSCVTHAPNARNHTTRA